MHLTGFYRLSLLHLIGILSNPHKHLRDEIKDQWHMLIHESQEIALNTKIKIDRNLIRDNCCPLNLRGNLGGSHKEK